MKRISNKVIFLITIGVVSTFPTPNIFSAKKILDAPNIVVSKHSSEGMDIANKIAELFRKENRPIQTDFPAVDHFQTTEITGSNTGTSINFNFNVAVDVSNGKISQIRLPHGDLLVLFVGADDTNRVNINPVYFQDFLSQTVGATHMAKIMGNGRGNSRGIVFMSWAKSNNIRKNKTDALRKHVDLSNSDIPKKNNHDNYIRRHNGVKTSNARAPLNVTFKST